MLISVSSYSSSMLTFCHFGSLLNVFDFNVKFSLLLFIQFIIITCVMPAGICCGITWQIKVLTVLLLHSGGCIKGSHMQEEWDKIIKRLVTIRCLHNIFDIYRVVFKCIFVNDRFIKFTSNCLPPLSKFCIFHQSLLTRRIIKLRIFN